MMHNLRHVTSLATLLALFAVGASVAAAASSGGTPAPRIQDLDARILDMPSRLSDLDNTIRTTESTEQVEVDISADVLFAFGKDTLSTKARATLDALARDLAEQSPSRVSIVGHTDSKGDAAFNQRLSERRAAAVRDALSAELGADVSFQVEGKGETDPIAAETKNRQDHPPGRQRNRRVVVTYGQ